MQRRNLMVASFFASATLGAAAAAEGPDWMNWRGPLGSGFAPDASPPIHWGPDKNVKWRVAIPGEGYASPIVLGDVVYVLSAIKTDTTAEPPPPSPQEERAREFGLGDKPTNVYKFVALALDRQTGEVVWSNELNEELPHTGVHPTASFASGSPVTDGEHIIAYFGSRGLFCLDMNGEVVWKKDLGDMQVLLSFGEGASPVLHGDKLIVPWDHEGDSYLFVFNKATGEELWRVPRTASTTWSTPVVANVNGRDQVITAATDYCVAYDLETGDEVWRSSGLTKEVIPTSIVANGMVYVMSGYGGASIMAIDLAKAKGDVSGTDAVVWSYNRATSYVPSPMLSGDGERIYFLRSNDGVLSCFDARTGERHYVGERLGAVRNVYASLVGADGRIYVCGREGDVAVVEDAPEFKLVATNSLNGEGINATPAIAGGELFLRTDGFLYCIAEGAR